MTDSTKETIPTDGYSANISVGHRPGTVLPETEFMELFHTDYRQPGNTGETATFDYQGMVRLGNGDVIYKDVLATNGLLAEPGKKGIHISTEGIVGYHAISANKRMKGP